MVENPHHRDSLSPFSPLPPFVSWSYVPNNLNIPLNLSSSLPSSPLQSLSDTILHSPELHPPQVILHPPGSPVDFHLPAENSTDHAMEEVGFATASGLAHLSWSNVPISLVQDTLPEELEFSSPMPGPSSHTFSELTALPVDSLPAGYHQVHFEDETPGTTFYSVPKFKLIFVCPWY